MVNDTAAGTEEIVHLRTDEAAGSPVSLLLTRHGDEVSVAHWGRRLVSTPKDFGGRPAGGSQVEDGYRPSILPVRELGWTGRPALRLRRGATVLRETLRALSVTEEPGREGVCVARVRHRGEHDAIELDTEFELGRGGLLRVRHKLRNIGADALSIDEAAVVMPIPVRARELLDFSGRWCRERMPQRHPLPFGVWSRATRHGRPGHDSPLLLAAGVPGFGYRHGEVWGTHLAWSGDGDTWAERLPIGAAALAAGEILQPEEVVLSSGEEHRTPWVCFAYSEAGLDGISAAFHGWLRARNRHPRMPRPVVVNGWEAVQFQHDPAVFEQVADDGARAGAELFMIDDGWFRGRRDDTRGLGDWEVDRRTWPEGLRPFADGLRERGMRVGLWFEPEMINEDSELARAHPEWIARPGGVLPPRWRHQQTLDLTLPEAWEHVRSRIDAVIREVGIDLLKWDQNRDPWATRPREQVLAVYRLMDELRMQHPELEIEVCSAGGARIDLEVLEHADRIWPTDTNDVVERARLQWWTQLLLPPELVGTQIGQATALHTTGRSQLLDSRALTAFFGHLGFEWGASRDRDGIDRPEELATWVALYRRLRERIHRGRLVRADLPDPALRLQGLVAPDGGDGIFLVTALDSLETEFPGPAPLPGLHPERSYRVSLLAPSLESAVAGGAFLQQRRPPTWLAEGVEATGGQLEAIGLELPALNPERSLLLDVVAVS